MELTINPKNVAPLLKKIERVAAAKSTIAALDDFLLQCNGGKLSVTAFDGEVMATTFLPILSSDGDFDFCVNARKLSQSINTVIKNDVVKIILDGNTTMTCYHQKGKFSLSYSNAEDYPTTPDKVDVATKCMLAKDISSIINDVSYAAGSDTLRPIMMGVYFDFTQNGLVGVATDTLKLVKTTINDDDMSDMKSFVMPIKAANIVSSFLEQSNADDKVLVTNDGKVVDIVLDGAWIVSFRQIDGHYPKYNAVIPVISTTTENKVRVNRTELIDSLQRALLFSPTQNNAIRIAFEDDKLELVAQDIDYNMSAKEVVACEHVGDNIVIGFNGSSLINILGHFASDDVLFNITDEKHAVLIYPNDSNVLAVVMPMMI